MSMDRTVLGPERGADLQVLLVAHDDGGVAISSVGLRQLVGVGGDPGGPLLPVSHPMFGQPGLPATRPGALAVSASPPWVIGVGSGEHVPVDWQSTHRVLAACGVR